MRRRRRWAVTNSPGSPARASGPVTSRPPTHGSARSTLSLLLSRVDRFASRPAAAVFVVAGAGAWLAVSIVAGFPARWETVFETVVSALTLAMVFVIQHTQARHQRATQRKLDEILLAMPDADNSLLTLEHASDEELHAVGHEHRSVRLAALEDEDEDEDEAGSRADGGELRLGRACAPPGDEFCHPGSSEGDPGPSWEHRGGKTLDRG